MTINWLGSANSQGTEFLETATKGVVGEAGKNAASARPPTADEIKRVTDYLAAQERQERAAALERTLASHGDHGERDEETEEVVPDEHVALLNDVLDLNPHDWQQHVDPSSSSESMDLFDEDLLERNSASSMQELV